MGAVLQKWAARLGLGQLPDTLRAQLESEGRILYLAASCDTTGHRIATAVAPKYLSFAWDASAQDAQTSGQMEVRLHLPDVATAAKILEQAGARMEASGR
jgi:hypothetical protein